MNSSISSAGSRALAKGVAVLAAYGLGCAEVESDLASPSVHNAAVDPGPVEQERVRLTVYNPILTLRGEIIYRTRLKCLPLDGECIDAVVMTLMLRTGEGEVIGTETFDVVPADGDTDVVWGVASAADVGATTYCAWAEVDYTVFEDYTAHLESGTWQCKDFTEEP